MINTKIFVKGIVAISFCYPVNQKILAMTLKMGFQSIYMPIMSYKSGHEWDINKSLSTTIHTIARNRSVKLGTGRLCRSGDSLLRVGEKCANLHTHPNLTCRQRPIGWSRDYTILHRLRVFGVQQRIMLLFYHAVVDSALHYTIQGRAQTFLGGQVLEVRAGGTRNLQLPY